MKNDTISINCFFGKAPDFLYRAQAIRNGSNQGNTFWASLTRRRGVAGTQRAGGYCFRSSGNRLCSLSQGNFRSNEKATTENTEGVGYKITPHFFPLWALWALWLFNSHLTESVNTAQKPYHLPVSASQRLPVSCVERFRKCYLILGFFEPCHILW